MQNLISLIVSPQYSQLLHHQQHGAQLVGSGQQLCHHDVCSWPGPAVSQWEGSMRMVWPMRGGDMSVTMCPPWLGKVVLKTIRWWGCHITSLITTYNPEQLIFTDYSKLYYYIIIVFDSKTILIYKWYVKYIFNTE